MNPMDIADSEKMVDYLVQNKLLIPKLAIGNSFNFVFLLIFLRLWCWDRKNYKRTSCEEI